MQNQFITIDTDNAIIRFHEGEARFAGIPEGAILQLRTDLATIASGMSAVTGCRFQLLIIKVVRS